MHLSENTSVEIFNIRRLKHRKWRTLIERSLRTFRQFEANSINNDSDFNFSHENPTHFDCVVLNTVARASDFPGHVRFGTLRSIERNGDGVCYSSLKNTWPFENTGPSVPTRRPFPPRVTFEEMRDALIASF